MLSSTLRRAVAAAALLSALAAGPLASEARAGVGDQAPDFGGKWINRADTTLADLKGRVVLIEFWRTW